MNPRKTTKTARAATTTRRLTVLGAGALTAAAIGLGASAPSVADTLSAAVQGSDDGATTTADADQDATTDSQTDSDGDGRPDGHRPGHGHGPGPRGGADLETAAQTLGLEQEELRTQLQAGSTLGEIADAQGVDRQVLVDALLAQQEERITALLDQPLDQVGGRGEPGHAAPPGSGADQGRSTPDPQSDTSSHTSSDGSSDR